jgi:hypothetical protein
MERKLSGRLETCHARTPGRGPRGAVPDFPRCTDGEQIDLAASGIGMPLLMLVAEGLWLRTGQPHYREWAKATGLLFALGAVSGTALSFELGPLWPRVMALAGSTIGPAFALGGCAFFVEAVFLGLYLYGWDRLSPPAHWLCGIPVALSGLLSGVPVCAVNAWMQAPVGFELDGSGRLTNIDPLATFRSPRWLPIAIHSSLSCYVAVGFAAAGVYAAGLLRGRRDAYHRSGRTIAIAPGRTGATGHRPFRRRGKGGGACLLKTWSRPRALPASSCTAYWPVRTSGGVWDLFAGGPRRDEQRAAIARAMGPAWEANHVWLIFVIVLLFTAFPAAFAALSVGLFGVFHFVPLGVSLRGAAFVFRGPQVGNPGPGHWGTAFGVASVRIAGRPRPGGGLAGKSPGRPAASCRGGRGGR